MSQTTDQTEESSGRPVPHVAAMVASVPWAITRDGLDAVCAVVERETAITPELLDRVAARKEPGTEGLFIRDGVGILTITGPMVRRANLMTMLCGGATYEGIHRDLMAAAVNPTIRAIMLNLDSPGGEVNGCAELAAAIRSVAATKPVEAYVGGQAASAAYWLACAANSITVSQTAVLGSIGVLMGIRDTSAIDAARGVRNIEFVSSRAPNKRLDYDSDAGRARIQKMADQFEAVFIGAVADYRGVSEETVASEFGAGGQEVGKDAVALGMADALGSFEGVLSKLSRGEGRTTPETARIQMADPIKTFSQAEVDAMVAAATAGKVDASATDAAAAAAATAAQTRIKTIMDHPSAKTRETFAKHLAFNTTMSADDAIGMMAVAGEEKPTAAAPNVPAGGRAADAAGGLALADANADTKAQAEPKEPVINADDIYASRAKAVADANRR